MKNDGEFDVWAIKNNLIVSLPDTVLLLEEHIINVAFLKQFVDELNGSLIWLFLPLLRLLSMATHYLCEAMIGQKAVETSIEF